MDDQVDPSQPAKPQPELEETDHDPMPDPERPRARPSRAPGLNGSAPPSPCADCLEAQEQLRRELLVVALIVGGLALAILLAKRPSSPVAAS